MTKKIALRAVMFFVIAAPALILGGLVSSPPKVFYHLVDRAYGDQCESGSYYGLSRGMSRVAALRRMGKADGDFPAEWYVMDRRGAAPRDVNFPLWAPSALPKELSDERRWSLVRAGYSRDFEMTVSFDDSGTISCADVEVRISLP